MSNCNYSKEATISFKPFSVKKGVTELYTDLFKDLEPHLKVNTGLYAKIVQTDSIPGGTSPVPNTPA